MGGVSIWVVSEASEPGQDDVEEKSGPFLLGVNPALGSSLLMGGLLL